MASINMRTDIFQDTNFVSSDIYSAVRLLDHMVVLFLIV
jgi:hypothetical protein